MRIAFVIQRYGAEIVGGSETLARQYASILREDHEIEVLTTCALDHVTWRNHYPPGYTEIDGIAVRRFPVDGERNDYSWHLYRMLQGSVDLTKFGGEPRLKAAQAKKAAMWPRALQEEMIRGQGPYSTPLFNYLHEHRLDYDAFLFFTYLFSPSYTGMPLVPAERTIFCPTLHDEPIAYLPVYRPLFHRARSTIFLTQTEQALARELYGFDGVSEVVGMAIPETPPVGAPPPGTPENYLLYAGRIEGGKGADLLLESFIEYKQTHPSDLKLVLIGHNGYPLPNHPDVLYRGFVSEAEKFALMKSALAFVHPSPFESFSIVLLESFLLETPALVNRHNAVLMEHCRASGAGIGFGDSAEFAVSLQQITAARRRKMGAAGKQYVLRNFRLEAVSERLKCAVRLATFRRSVADENGLSAAAVELGSCRPIEDPTFT